jgi:cytochrome c biogenesis protein CcdA
VTIAWTERASGALADMIEQGAATAPFLAFLGGALTALNPCVLAMIPLMVGVAAGIAGRSALEGRTAPVWPRTLLFSLLFVSGFALELALLFTVFAAAAETLRGPWWNYVLAAICGLVGFHLLGVVRLPAMPLPAAATRAGGVLAAVLLGFLFGLVSLPCTGPVLLLLLALVPKIGAARAGGLLFLYGLGHSLLILAVGTAVGVATSLVQAERLQIAAHRLRQAAGVLVLVAGVWLLFS